MDVTLKIKSLIPSLWRGDVPLWKSFWIFGLAVPVGYLLLQFLIFINFDEDALRNSFCWISAIKSIVGLGYTILICVAIWRSASKHQGRIFFANLAKATIAIYVGFIVFNNIYVFIKQLGPSGISSHNVVFHLESDPNLPYIGFWKRDCKENFGLAIDKSGDHNGPYSVSFCGPNGCFGKGTYRPNTNLANDPVYRIVDQDTIEVKGLDGFSTYHRCAALGGDQKDKPKQR